MSTTTAAPTATDHHHLGPATLPADYYTKACVCGANPAYHLGHSRACVDSHRTMGK